MKTLFPIILALAFALSGTMLAASGYTNIVGEERHSDKLSNKVESAANQSTAAKNEGFGSGITGIIGIVLSAGSQILTFVKIVLLLPMELAKNGFPSWAAFTIGPALQIVATVGFLQFVGGRIWR